MQAIVMWPGYELLGMHLSSSGYTVPLLLLYGVCCAFGFLCVSCGKMYHEDGCLINYYYYYYYYYYYIIIIFIPAYYYLQHPVVERCVMRTDVQ